MVLALPSLSLFPMTKIKQQHAQVVATPTKWVLNDETYATEPSWAQRVLCNCHLMSQKIKIIVSHWDVYVFYCHSKSDWYTYVSSLSYIIIYTLLYRIYHNLYFFLFILLNFKNISPHNWKLNEGKTSICLL